MIADSTGFEPHLLEYYRTAGVAAADFRCGNAALCQAVMSGIALCRGRAAFVGSNYGRALKILVVAMDDGGTPPESTANIEAEIAARQATIEGKEPSNMHLIGTTAFAEILLRQSSNLADGRRSLSYCAMVNAAKCSSSGGVMKPTLYKNCWQFAAKEIEILRPELIWLQGNRVFETVAAARSSDGAPVLQQVPDEASEFPRHIRFSLYKGTTPVIFTRHPSARGSYRPNFRGDEVYRQAAKVAIGLIRRHSIGRV